MVDNNIPEGNTVEILETDYLLHRHPHLIGLEGSIVHAPEHPNTWYTIFVPSAHETIKLQATSIKFKGEVAAKASSPHAVTKVKESPKQLPMSAPSPKFSPLSRPRSNSYTSSIKEFKIGSKVAIIETDNVSQRAPHLIGQVGIIREVPVHPATWFKVEFPDHQTLTFRPSAFKSLGDCDSENGSVVDLPYMNLPKNASKRDRAASFDSDNFSAKKKKKDYMVTEDGDTSDNDNELDFDESSNTNENHQNSSSNESNNSLVPANNSSTKQVMLDTIDPELWTGTIVHILGGKCHDQRGEIMRSGNGWVQIITESKEEVAKRAHELIVIKIPAERVPRPNKDDLKKMKKAIAETKIVHQDNHLPYDDRPKRLRKIPKSNNYLYNHPNDKFNNNLNDNNSSYKSRIKINLPVSYDKPKPFIPSNYGIKLLSDELIKQKRLLIEQYVNSQNYIKNRPNLSFFLSEIKDNFIDTSNEIDNVVTICNKCKLEMWPNAQHCWNEMCPSSPIYWKLCGSNPSSSTPKTNIDDNQMNSLVQTKKRRSDSGLTDLEMNSPELISLLNNPNLNTTKSYENLKSLPKAFETIQPNVSDAELLSSIYIKPNYNQL